MDIKMLYDVIPSWEWPVDAGRQIQEILENRGADPADRLMAAELAGDDVVMNDGLARTLLSIVAKSDEPAELRAMAAIFFGPAFEYADIYEFDDPDDIVLSQETFLLMQEELKKLYHDTEVPANVRRSILEAEVRAPQDWHADAVRTAHASDDENWQLTAVFCMRFIKGFDRQILKALESEDVTIRYQAIIAAGNWGLKKAWPQVSSVLADDNAERETLLAAIDAAAAIGTPEALQAVRRFINSDDEELSDAAIEALSMIEADDDLKDAFNPL